MNVLALCSGTLGLELGLKRVFGETRIVCAVEREAFAVANMVSKIENGTMAPFPIWSDVRTFSGSEWRGVVDCITAGYPCTPFSVAGKQLGEKDERFLWPDISRIIGEVRPAIVVCENSPNHLHHGFDSVVKDMEAMDYTVAAVLSTAWSFGAPHIRERLYWAGFFSSNPGLLSDRFESWGFFRESRKYSLQSGKSSQERVNTNSDCFNGDNPVHGSVELRRKEPTKIQRVPFRLTESPVCGTNDGLANRVDRLRLCGNGVVPRQAEMSLRVILDGKEWKP